MNPSIDNICWGCVLALRVWLHWKRLVQRLNHQSGEIDGSKHDPALGIFARKDIIGLTSLMPPAMSEQINERF